MRKLRNYLGISLLLFSTSQCHSRCGVKPVYDTTKLKLAWQEAKTWESSEATFDLRQASEGQTCYVPTEDAVYYIDLDGNAWKFTRNSQPGSLLCQAINNIPTDFRVGKGFSFLAGSKDNPTLFVGKLTSLPSDNILLWKYENENWQEIADPYPSFSTWYTLNQACASCTLETNDQLYGCLSIGLNESGTMPPTGKICFLAFEPNMGQFTILKPLIPRLISQNIDIAISPAPNKLILGQQEPGQHHTFDMFDLQLSDTAVTALPKKITNEVSAQQWKTALLKFEGAISVMDPLFYNLEADAYKFYRLDAKNHLVSAGDLPNNQALRKETLILPFADEIFCITKESDEADAPFIYYQGKLALAN